MKRFAVFIGFIVVASLLGWGVMMSMEDPGFSRNIPSPFIGKPAPAFELARLKRPAQTIGTQDMLGKVWLLNVWASWCVACRAEHQVVTRFARTGEVPIIGLNYKDEAENALGWLSQLGDPYTAIAVDREGDVGIDWGVYGVPETFVVDKKGIIRYKQIGPVTDEAIAEKLLPLIHQLKSES